MLNYVKFEDLHLFLAYFNLYISFFSLVDFLMFLENFCLFLVAFIRKKMLTILVMRVPKTTRMTGELFFLVYITFNFNISRQTRFTVSPFIS